MFGNERQIGSVFVSHGLKMQLAVWQVDPLVGRQLGTSRGRMGDANVEAIWFRSLDDPSNPCQPHLQGPQVAASQCLVVQQIPGALELTRVDMLEAVNRFLRQGDEIASNFDELVD
jgi:hypothetical protein